MIRCSDLIVGYGDKIVLNGVDFTARAGESVAIIGPNGSGKTTLLRIISGVLKPKVGVVRLTGKEMVKLNSKARARIVAVVPQRQTNLPMLTVRDFVLLGRYPHLSWFGAYAEKDYIAADDACVVTGISNLANYYLDQLSGGEMQRVALARALAQETQILLLDELSAGLDLARMIDLFDLLEMRRKAGCCIIMIMHDLNLAALYATRILGIKKGQIAFNGKVQDIFKADILSDFYDTDINVIIDPLHGYIACPQSKIRSFCEQND